MTLMPYTQTLKSYPRIMPRTQVLSPDSAPNNFPSGITQYTSCWANRDWASLEDYQDPRWHLTWKNKSVQSVRLLWGCCRESSSTDCKFWIAILAFESRRIVRTEWRLAPDLCAAPKSQSSCWRSKSARMERFSFWQSMLGSFFGRASSDSAVCCKPLELWNEVCLKSTEVHLGFSF